MTSLRRVAVILLIIILVGCFASCNYGGATTMSGEKIDFLALELSALEGYVEIGQYTELEIELGESDKGSAVWNAVISGSKVKSYPEKQVYYYVEQLQGQYKYYAEQAGISYEEMLGQLGMDEVAILKEAKAMTKGDIIYAIVVKKENISLSESEKQSLVGRYVDKYVSEYGYTKEYVEKNLIDEIYGSMLYDKTTEFLIINNRFE